MGNLYESVLITGGNGMLAHAFSRVLDARGVNPVIVARNVCDIADPLAVSQTLDRVKPTLILNCAAYTKVDLAEKEFEQAKLANGVGPGVLAAHCRERGIALVHFSTDYVFDGTLSRPLRTDDPVGPQSAYGKSKLLGEQAIQRNAPPRWLIARTAWLYGPNGPNFVKTMVNAAEAGKKLSVVNDQVGTPTYTFDLATTTLELLDRGATGVWHVTNAGQTNWFEFAAAIFEEWGLKPELSSTTSAQWKKSRPDSAIRPSYSVLDVSPAAKLLGHEIRDWREALRAFKDESRDQVGA